MLITRREELEVEYGFQKAFETDLSENEEMAIQAIVAWNRFCKLIGAQVKNSFMKMPKEI
jgi:hypothetical protein